MIEFPIKEFIEYNNEKYFIKIVNQWLKPMDNLGGEKNINTQIIDFYKDTRWNINLIIKYNSLNKFFTIGSTIFFQSSQGLWLSSLDELKYPYSLNDSIILGIKNNKISTQYINCLNEDKNQLYINNIFDNFDKFFIFPGYYLTIVSWEVFNYEFINITGRITTKSINE